MPALPFRPRPAPRGRPQQDEADHQEEQHARYAQPVRIGRLGDDADGERRHPRRRPAGEGEQAEELAGHALGRQPADHGAAGRLHRAHADAEQQGEAHEHPLLQRAEQVAGRLQLGSPG